MNGCHVTASRSIAPSMRRSNRNLLCLDLPYITVSFGKEPFSIACVLQWPRIPSCCCYIASETVYLNHCFLHARACYNMPLEKKHLIMDTDGRARRAAEPLYRKAREWAYGRFRWQILRGSRTRRTWTSRFKRSGGSGTSGLFWPSWGLRTPMRRIRAGAEVQTDAEIRAWIGESMTIVHHASGTNTMGVESDESAVVDSGGPVFGVGVLRIVGASARGFRLLLWTGIGLVKMKDLSALADDVTAGLWTREQWKEMMLCSLRSMCCHIPKYFVQSGY